MAVYNNKLYFSADDGTHGRELWVYNSTNADIAPTLTMVADIAQGLGSSSPVRPPPRSIASPRARVGVRGCGLMTHQRVRAMLPMPVAITFSANRPHLSQI